MRKYLTVLVYTQTNIRLSVGGQRWIFTMARSGLVNSPPSFGEWLLTITSYYFVNAMLLNTAVIWVNFAQTVMKEISYQDNLKSVLISSKTRCTQVFFVYLIDVGIWCTKVTWLSWIQVSIQSCYHLRII